MGNIIKKQSIQRNAEANIFDPLLFVFRALVSHFGGGLLCGDFLQSYHGQQGAELSQNCIVLAPLPHGNVNAVLQALGSSHVLIVEQDHFIDIPADAVQGFEALVIILRWEISYIDGMMLV